MKFTQKQENRSRIFPYYTDLAMLTFFVLLKSKNNLYLYFKTESKFAEQFIQFVTISNLLPTEAVQKYINIANFVYDGKTRLSQLQKETT